MITDSDNKILQAAERLSRLQQRLTHVVPIWIKTVEDLRSGMTGAMFDFVATPISKDIDKGHASLRTIYVDITGGPSKVYCTVLEKLAPMIQKYEIEFRTKAYE